MTIKVDLTLRIVEEAKSSGAPLTPDQLDDVHRTIVALNNRVVEFEEAIRRDTLTTKRAVQAFRRAKSWPLQMTPSLSELISWLLDRSHVEDNLDYVKTLEGIAEKLNAFQSLTFEARYEVSGGWLIDLNTRVLGILSKHRPPPQPDMDEPVNGANHFNNGSTAH